MISDSWHENISYFYFKETETLNMWEQLLVAGSLFIIYLVVAALAYIIVKNIVVSLFSRVAKMTQNKWDDELMTSRVFRRLSLLVPIAIISKQVG